MGGGAGRTMAEDHTTTPPEPVTMTERFRGVEYQIGFYPLRFLQGMRDDVFWVNVFYDVPYPAADDEYTVYGVGVGYFSCLAEAKIAAKDHISEKLGLEA